MALLSHIQLPCLISGVVDAINGVTKTKLTAAKVRKSFDPEEGRDVENRDPSTMRRGGNVSCR